MTIAIIGGTGNLGFGLALRWARAGHTVIIGSRSPERAVAAAAAANEQVGGARVEGRDNAGAAAAADIVVLAVPWAAHPATLESIRAACQGKVVVDTTVPMGAKPTIPGLDGTSAAEQVQEALGPGSRVVAGLHHLSAKRVADLDQPIEADVLICGDDGTAKAAVLDLVRDLPARAFDAGDLTTARTLERLTPLIIGLNIRYKRRHIGLKLTGI